MLDTTLWKICHDQLLQDSDVNVRLEAVRVAHRVHDDATPQALLEYIQKNGTDRGGLHRLGPLDALAAIGGKDARKVLQTVYDGSSGATREAAANALDSLDKGKR